MKFGFDVCDEGNMDGDEGCTKFNGSEPNLTF